MGRIRPPPPGGLGVTPDAVTWNDASNRIFWILWVACIDSTCYSHKNIVLKSDFVGLTLTPPITKLIKNDVLQPNGHSHRYRCSSPAFVEPSRGLSYKNVMFSHLNWPRLVPWCQFKILSMDKVRLYDNGWAMGWPFLNFSWDARLLVLI